MLKKKINETIQEARERFNEQLEKNTYIPIVMKDLKLYISKFVNDKGLIYLRTRNFRKIKEYSAEWMAKRIREESKEKVVEILRI